MSKNGQIKELLSSLRRLAADKQKNRALPETTLEQMIIELQRHYAWNPQPTCLEEVDYLQISCRKSLALFKLAALSVKDVQRTLKGSTLSPSTELTENIKKAPDISESLQVATTTMCHLYIQSNKTEPNAELADRITQTNDIANDLTQTTKDLLYVAARQAPHLLSGKASQWANAIDSCHTYYNNMLVKLLPNSFKPALHARPTP
ncbi:MAG: hypothetical protein AB7E52_00985 [Bdellovibrionales bacterium]